MDFSTLTDDQINAEMVNLFLQREVLINAQNQIAGINSALNALAKEREQRVMANNATPQEPETPSIPEVSSTPEE